MSFPKIHRLCKRILSLLLSATLLSSLLMVGAAAAEAQEDLNAVKDALNDALFLGDLFDGSGTSNDPYQISNETQLIYLQLLTAGEGTGVQDEYQFAQLIGNLYFQLTADITLTAAWSPIGADRDQPFTGFFDGGGHTISGLNLTMEKKADGTPMYAGLFGYADGAVIQNLTVSGTVSASVTAGSDAANTALYASGIVAYAVDTVLTDCTASAVTVTANNADTGNAVTMAGGVAGYTGVSSADVSRTVINCAADSGTTVSVTGADSAAAVTVAGGVIGMAKGVNVSGGLSAATVTTVGSATLFTVSSNDEESYLLQNYANTAGGFVGAALGLYTVKTDTETTGMNRVMKAFGEVTKRTSVTGCISTAAVQNLTADTEVTLWTYGGGVVGTALIADVSDCTFSGSVTARGSGGIVGISDGASAITSCTLQSGANVTARSDISHYCYAGGIVCTMGTSSTLGLFSGFTLSGCKTEADALVSGAGGAGGIVRRANVPGVISGCVNRASVSILSSTNTAVGAGGVAGSLMAGVVLRNCENYGPVTTTVTAGGVVGYVASATVADCFNAGKVSQAENTLFSYTPIGYVGGVVGEVGSTATDAVIERCTNTGTVSAESGTSVGGVIGFLSNGNTRNCVNTGVVAGGSANNAGGLVGISFSTVLNSYNTGAVSGGVTGAGGIVGRVISASASTTSTAANCYSTGTVTSTATNVGAVAGEHPSGTLTSCYALTGTAEVLDGSGTGTNLSFFSADQTLTAPVTIGETEYTDLLSALNAYVTDQADGVSYFWTDGSGDSVYPIHSTGEIATLPDAPGVPEISARVGGEDLASGGNAAAGSAVTLTAAVEAVEGSELLYQWYSGVNGTSVDTLTKIEGATEQSYTCVVADDASGPQYYYVEVKSLNQYGTSGAVTSGVFTFTAMAEGKWYPGMTEEFDGSGTTSDPYVIDTPAKLAYLAQRVNGGNSYAGEYFRQTADLDLDSQLWTAIGTEENPFAGVYDGGRNSIINLYGFHEYAETDGTEEYQGVFGAVSGTVENLTVSGTLTSWLNTTWEKTTQSGSGFQTVDTTKKYYVYMGGVAAKLLEGGSVSGCTVQNLTLTAKCIEAFDYWLPRMGGVVGSVTGGTISDCTVAGSVTVIGPANATGNYTGTGGLAGYAEGIFTMEDCSSAADVTGRYAGGAVGWAEGPTGSARGTVSQVENTGSVSGVANVGGLVGYCAQTDITGGENSGTVSAVSSAGGLVGSIVSSAVSNSRNTGAVTNGAYCGGLAGQLYVNSPVIYNCYNTGDVSGTYAGGLAGYLNYGSGKFFNCYSAGAVSGITAAGGLAGRVNTSYVHTLSHCYFLEADGLPALGSADGSKDTVESIGSFDANRTVTAVNDTTLEYAGELLYQLIGWAISNQKTYPDVMGWTLGEDGYPVLSDSFDLTQMAAAPQVTLTDGPIQVELNSATTLTASVTVAASGNAEIGTVTYQWYKDGTPLDGASGTLTHDADESIGETLTLNADTQTAGTFVYTLRVDNVTQYHRAVASADVTVKINKAEGDTTWYGEIADSFHSGTGTESDPYIIADADELAYLAQQVNAGTSYAGQFITLAHDLDLNSMKWTPIGTNGKPFQGTFDGGGHTISGLYINTNSSYQGLFGFATSATVQNLVVSGSVKGGIYVGGLIGYAKTTLTLVNCGNEADVTGTYNVGGLVGYGYGPGAAANSCVLTGCYNTGTVRATSSGSGKGLGGLAGYLYMKVTLTDCYNAGSIAGPTTVYTGGLVGYLYNGSNYPATMTNCFSVGKIGATSGTYAGALVGYVYWADYCTTTNCYRLTSAFGSDYVDSTAITEAELANLSETLGEAFVSTVSGTVTFQGEHVKVLVNGEETTAVTVAGYPALAWEDNPARSSTVAFTMEADEGYAVSTVTVDGNVLEADANGVYTVNIDADITVTITVAAAALSYEPKIQNAGEANEDGSYTVTAANAAISIATVIAPENGWTLDMENTFTVSAENACLVAVTTDGGVTYTRLAATANADGAYSFSVTLTEDAELTVARLGDTDGDGIVATLDVSIISQSLAGATTLGEGALSADVDNDGSVTTLDTAAIISYLRGSMADFNW